MNSSWKCAALVEEGHGIKESILTRKQTPTQWTHGQEHFSWMYSGILALHQHNLLCN